MSKGENIFKRKDGRWEARYIKGYELSGKIRYGFCYGKTYREAKEKVTKIKAAALAGMPAPIVSRRRFAYYCDEWLLGRRTRVKEATYIKYETMLERHIKPRLGGCFPQGITAAEIPYPRCARREMRVLSREEQERFAAYLMKDMDECKFGVLLTLSTGIRIGELCALRWGNILLSERTIRITATLQRLRDTGGGEGTKTRVVTGSPKSETSARTIPLTDFAAELCARMTPGCEDAYVLTGTREYMEPRALQYRMEKYTRACALEGVHFHTLRHTFAMRTVEVEFEIKSLSEILGHASTKVTLDRCVHSSMQLKRDNMNKLAAVGV